MNTFLRYSIIVLGAATIGFVWAQAALLAGAEYGAVVYKIFHTDPQVTLGVSLLIFCTIGMFLICYTSGMLGESIQERCAHDKELDEKFRGDTAFILGVITICTSITWIIMQVSWGTGTWMAAGDNGFCSGSFMLGWNNMSEFNIVYGLLICVPATLAHSGYFKARKKLLTKQ